MKYLFLLLAVSFSSFAQPAKLEKMKAYKVAFLTTELNLTADEAAKFWPIYNDYSQKRNDLRFKGISRFRDRHNADYQKMSDKEASQMLAQIEANEDEEHQLRKKLMAEVKQVLPPVKILKLKKAEEDFNRKLLQQYREKSRRD
jgi:hypothetical protein